MYINLLTKLKNAQLAKKKFFEVQFNRFDRAVAEILLKAGYLTKIDVKGKAPKIILELHLNAEKPVRGLKFLSRPSVQRYIASKDIYKVRGGLGLLVISTSKGVMTGEEAKKARLGGQLLFEIW